MKGVALVGSTAAAILLGLVSAHAGEVVPGSGVVSVNTGNGFYRITGLTQVPPGARVKVSPGGSAQVNYGGGGGGCGVSAGQIMTVGSGCPSTTGIDISSLMVGGGFVAAGVGLSIASDAPRTGKRPASP